MSRLLSLLLLKATAFSISLLSFHPHYDLIVGGFPQQQQEDNMSMAGFASQLRRVQSQSQAQPQSAGSESAGQPSGLNSPPANRLFQDTRPLAGGPPLGGGDQRIDKNGDAGNQAKMDNRKISADPNPPWWKNVPSSSVEWPRIPAPAGSSGSVGGAAGSARYPGSSGSAISPGSTGSAISPGSTGSAISPESTGSAISPGSTGSAISPESTGSAISHGSTGSALSPGSTGSAISPGSTGSAVSPGSTGSAISPASTGSAISPGSTGSTGSSGSEGRSAGSTASTDQNTADTDMKKALERSADALIDSDNKNSNNNKGEDGHKSIVTTSPPADIGTTPILNDPQYRAKPLPTRDPIRLPGFGFG